MIEAGEAQRTSLVSEAQTLVQSGKLLLPAVLLLFVFQAGDTMTPVFLERLALPDRIAGGAGLALLGVAAGGMFLPSAHRRHEMGHVSTRTISTLQRSAEWPLSLVALNFALNVYLEARLVVRSLAFSLILAAAVLAIFLWLWVAYPRVVRAGQPSQDPA